MNELENMTVGEALGVLRERIEESRLVESNARIDRERNETAFAALERLVNGAGSSPPEASPKASAERPSLLGLAAVREVMRESPAHVWTPREIHEVLESRGWLSGKAKYARAGTESAVGRLLGKGEIVKVARGRYRWRDDQEAITES